MIILYCHAFACFLLGRHEEPAAPRCLFLKVQGVDSQQNLPSKLVGSTSYLNLYKCFLVCRSFFGIHNFPIFWVYPKLIFEHRSWRVWPTWCPELRSLMLGSKRVACGRPTSSASALGPREPPQSCGGLRQPPGGRACGGRPRRPENAANDEKCSQTAVVTVWWGSQNQLFPGTPNNQLKMDVW